MKSEVKIGIPVKIKVSYSELNLKLKSIVEDDAGKITLGFDVMKDKLKIGETTLDARYIQEKIAGFLVYG